jgi:hypothetical protein
MDPQAMNTGSELSAALVVSYMAVHVIEWLKRARWFPLLDRYTDKANQMASAIIAVAASIGIGIQFDTTAGTLLITGLTYVTVQNVVIDALRQFVMQQIGYRLLIKPKPSDEGTLIQ